MSFVSYFAVFAAVKTIFHSFFMKLVLIHLEFIILSLAYVCHRNFVSSLDNKFYACRVYTIAYIN